MKKRGFTLIEVLIALAIFSVGMLSVVTITSQSQLITRTSAVRTRAALLSQEGLETALAAGYEQLSVTEPFLNENSLSALGADFTYFSRQVTIQYLDGNMQISATDHGLKLITSTITWDQRSGDTSNNAKTFTTTTVIANL